MAALDHAYPNGRYLNPNDFITPNDPAVQVVAAGIVTSLGGADSPSTRLREAYNYVALNIKYITDKAHYGYPEVWAMPSETLKRGLGDCEDSSFLLCSLLLALEVPAHVVFGVYKGEGHAWVEAGFNGIGGILETTGDQPFIGFADPSAYGAEQTVGDFGPQDPTMDLVIHIAPGLILFGVGAFLMLDDAPDAFKLELSKTRGVTEPGTHGILRGMQFPWMPPHPHHWLIGILVVILGIILLAVGVILWLLKYA
jgi:hypothetical protein